MNNGDLVQAVFSGNLPGDALNDAGGTWVGRVIDARNTLAVIMVAYAAAETGDSTGSVTRNRFFERNHIDRIFLNVSDHNFAQALGRFGTVRQFESAFHVVTVMVAGVVGGVIAVG